jgi:hypothetical protein
MIKKTLIISISALFAGAVAMSSYAAESGGFETMDTNADGMISAEEAAANGALTESWGAIDVNQDGQLDAAEFSAFEVEVIEVPAIPAVPAVPAVQ